jgi:hypothetical protein
MGRRLGPGPQTEKLERFIRLIEMGTSADLVLVDAGGAGRSDNQSVSGEFRWWKHPLRGVR